MSLAKRINQVIGDEGIKTDISITLTNASALKLGAVIIGSILISYLAITTVKGVAKA